MSGVFRKYFEISIWTVALAMLAFIPIDENSISFCPLHFLGFAYCPGCGLGRSIHLAFAGSFAASFKMHPMGIPAIFVIIHRIIRLFKIKILNRYHATKYTSRSASLPL